MKTRLNVLSVINPLIIDIFMWIFSILSAKCSVILRHPVNFLPVAKRLLNLLRWRFEGFRPRLADCRKLRHNRWERLWWAHILGFRPKEHYKSRNLQSFVAPQGDSTCSIFVKFTPFIQTSLLYLQVFQIWCVIYKLNKGSIGKTVMGQIPLNFRSS